MFISVLPPALRAADPFAPRETLSDQVLKQIKEILLTGQVVPGETLSLRSTAAALGVSVMPVRQAVYQLVADRALEATPNRSVRVPMMTAAQFHEITQIRLEIESYAVAQAGARVTPSLLSSLREINAELSRCLEAGPQGLAQVVLLNKALHFSLYEASGMPMLVKMIESLWLRIGPVLNYDLRSGSERTRNKIAAQHHANLIDALEAHAVGVACEAVRQDILGAYEYIIKQHMGYSEGTRERSQLLTRVYG
ncbi:MAG TPA: GntR family transcriptional regulator [Polaromonas sp.]|uniref:GntR family transcriptional regulator n=1 Tax=Polaromonas sp. UBA4122 TaxID=1947074 RepID=UPI000EEE90A6|nr:GntR family transcriptional regulator [Polaromonas sp. UBA4122]HAL39070.1 GntR family transcriptional regulator [Polaromonas sp.]